jgi:hypothetical protein
MTVMDFEVRVAGDVSPGVLDELPGIRVVSRSFDTVLQGPVPGQDALIGIINLLQDLGVELHGVRQLATGDTATPSTHHTGGQAGQLRRA